MSHHPPAGPHRRSSWVVGWLCLLALAGGCGQPKIGDQANAFAIGLDRVLEKRDAAQLAQAAERLQTEQEQAAITEREAKILRVLIERAKSDDWEGARSRLRSLLTAQVNW